MSLINDALKQASQAQRSQRAPRIPDEILKPADGPTPPRRSFFSKYVAPFLRALIALILLGGGALLYYQWTENQLGEAGNENVGTGKKSSRQKQAGKMAAKSDGGGEKVSPPVPTPPDTAKSMGTNAVVNPPVIGTNDTPSKTNQTASLSTNSATTLHPATTNDLVPFITPLSPTGAVTVVQAPTNSGVSVPSGGLFAPITNTNTVASTTNSAPTNAVAIQQPFPRLRLQGIGFRPNNPFALINNRNVMVGDVIDDARVIRIERSSVIFEFFGRTNEVWMLR